MPEGATPRTLSLHLRGEVTRQLKAGDSVVLAGVFLPEPFSGWKAMRCVGIPLAEVASSLSKIWSIVFFTAEGCGLGSTLIQRSCNEVARA